MDVHTAIQLHESVLQEVEKSLHDAMKGFVGLQISKQMLENIRSTLESSIAYYKERGIDLPGFSLVVDGTVVTIQWDEEKQLSTPDDLVKENGNVGFQKVVEQNTTCEHRVVVSREDYGKSAKVELGVTFPQQDCPFCIRRWMHYWRNRAESGGK